MTATMNLVLTDDQKLLKDSAKSFCQQNTPVSELRKLRDTKDETGFDKAVWQQMVELGWPGMAVPEAYGGFAFGHGGLGIVLEETGRTLASSPLIGTVLLGANCIIEMGSEEQKQSLLPQIIAGELLLSLALDEKPIHTPSSINTSIERSGEDYLINGKKTFVLDGHVADKFIVVGRSHGDSTGVDGISLFIVDAGTEGVNIVRTNMVDNRNSANIEFSNVRVPASALLGELNFAYAGLEKVLDIARIGIAAEMLGGVQEVFDRILDYLKQREQFGVLIGSFQGLQHRAAIMYSEIELCKSAVRAALSALDNPDQDSKTIAELASIAKAKLSEVFCLVSNEGIQMHGGIGMTDEFDIGFFIKRARVAQQFLGDASFHRDRYATLNNF